MTNRSLPSVTVVIPVYNGEVFVEHTVRSALAQTYPNLEVLIVDDGSSDATPAILDHLKTNMERLRVVSIPNGGVANARNVGTQLSTARYVAYLDADDLWHPTKIEKQVATLERHGEDPTWVACYTLYRQIDSEGRVLGAGASHETRGTFFPSHLAINHVGNGSSLLVRRDAALAVGGFDPSYVALGIGGCEDWDFQMRLLQRYQMDLVREFLVGYRIYPGNMSSNLSSMTGASLAVFENFATDPRLAPDFIRLARGRKNRVALAKYLRIGRWGDVARTFGTSLHCDLLGFLRDIVIRGPSILYRGSKWAIRRCVPSALPSKWNKDLRRHFDTYLPEGGLMPADSLPEAALRQRLARFDAEFELDTHS